MHLCRPVEQTSVHTPSALQVEVDPVTKGHAAHDGPHELAELATHWPPQRLKPGRQAKPHAPVTQLGAELAGPAGQAVHDAPQLEAAVLLTQAPAHM